MKTIVYLDYVSGDIIFHKVDVREMNYEYGDVYAYADAHAPSNNCQWMEVTKDCKIIGDKEVLNSIVEKVIVKKEEL